jgi:hypothetical protein
MRPKKYIPFFLFIFLLSSFRFSLAQCTDPSRQPDKYHIINTDYYPVCGCDGKTYRNSDAAYWWGGINQWTDGSCESFDVDLYPNVLSSGGNSLAHIRIYMKAPGNATLVIYNAFGRKMLEQIFFTSLSNNIIADANPYELYDAQNYPTGIYFVIVSVNGDKKFRKFTKATQ